MSCSIASCNNRSRRKDQTREHVTYHTFPKNADVKKMWIKCCSWNNQWNPHSSRICSDHFESDDYERDLKAELLGLPVKRKLKKSAVPSRKLGQQKTEEHVSASTKPPSTRYSQSQIEGQPSTSSTTDILRTLLMKTDILSKNLSPDQIEENPDTSVVFSCGMPVVSDSFSICETAWKQDEVLPPILNSEANIRSITLDIAESEGPTCKSCDYFKERLKCKEEDCINLKNEVSKLKNAKERYRNTILMKELKLRDLNNSILSIRSKYFPKSFIDRRVKETLTGIFTPNQVRILTGKRKHVKWSNEEISTALTLRYLSKRAYIFLQKKLKYPLPSISSLQKRTKV